MGKLVRDRAGMVAYAVAGVILGIGARVAADNFGSFDSNDPIPNGVYVIAKTGNGITNYRRKFRLALRQMQTSWSNDVKAAFNNNYRSLTFPYAMFAEAFVSSSCVDADHEACAYAFDYGNNNLNGWTDCNGTRSGSHPNMSCSLTRIRFNTFYSQFTRRTVACHEIGHAWGLQHTAELDSCLNLIFAGEFLTQHDITHLQSAYFIGN